MKILLDMNLSPVWIDLLKRHAEEVVHWSSIGANNEEDSAIAEFARRENFIIVTQDLDFGSILSASALRKPSVLLLRAGRVTPVTMGAQVISAMEQLQDELSEGAFVTIEARRTRVSSLPLGKT